MANIEYNSNDKKSVKIGIVSYKQYNAKTLAQIIYMQSKQQRKLNPLLKADFKLQKEAEEME